MSLTSEQAERYSRHFVLREIGVKGQKKLLESSVLVIGAGGLGSAALLYLAAAGIGTLGIVDYDKVELHNLQRQIIHRTESVGVSKVLSAKAAVLALNPDVNVVCHNEKMTADNIQAVIANYDFILDCTDRFESKFLINDACVLSKKPYTHAGVVRFEGQVMTYLPEKGPCLRCLLGDVPRREAAPTCAQVGVVGAVVGAIGSIQALEAIKYLLGEGELLVGRVLRFNGLNMDMRVVPFSSTDPDCAICGSSPRIASLIENRGDYEESCGG